jgi:hypothetical protein
VRSASREDSSLSRGRGELVGGVCYNLYGKGRGRWMPGGRESGVDAINSEQSNILAVAIVREGQGKGRPMAT